MANYHVLPNSGGGWAIKKKRHQKCPVLRRRSERLRKLQKCIQSKAVEGRLLFTVEMERFETKTQ
jgi:hypothetical protein